MVSKSFFFRLVMALGLAGTLLYSLNIALSASRSPPPARLQQIVAPDWFPFTPVGGNLPAVLGMENWLEKPAGNHGGVRIVNDHFEFADGTSIKFWGTNLSYLNCAPERPIADATAQRFAHYGINGVRLHKFTGTAWEGIGDPNDATKFDPKALDNLDYFTSRLAANGVYYGFSHTYHFKVRPDNKSQLAAYDEIQNNLKGDTYGLINVADDVQNLMIQMVIQLLNHKNPQTGKTYAQDPALSYIELQNEDDIFFYTTESALKACPTYARKLTEKFSDWLTTKYGTQTKLKTVWGPALNNNESLQTRNIAIQSNPWFFSDDHLPQKIGGERQRLLDNAAFFHDIQNTFYARFTAAIRATGYQGPLVGSPWQAPGLLPRYYNLRSDYLVGTIDRHNYFGAKVEDSMLAQPGSGLLWAGLEQVIDRPFVLSEWITTYPSLYSAEGPVLIAAYGMGLQGWSGSYQFNSEATSAPGFAPDAGHLPWGLWNADVPTQIGQFPALARMVFRGDITRADILSIRKIAPQDLQNGHLNFADKKSPYTSFCPPEALAAGRCVIQFTDAPAPSTFPDLTPFKHGTTLISSTNQLAWNTAGKGSFTINTPGTKGLVGFAQNQPASLGNVTITAHCPYVSILLTAIDKTATLDTARTALLIAVARNANTNFSYALPDQAIVDNGKSPIMLEPVKASLHFTGRPLKWVRILDHDGRHTGKFLPVADNTLLLDTGRDHTLYYELSFE